ncbi:MAG: hypothetical protein R2734_14475 [Nocardioides sp.]
MWTTPSGTAPSRATPTCRTTPVRGCGHAQHTYLPCSDSCDCRPGVAVSGLVATA